MTVNNEIGVQQPVAEIGALCRKHKTFFHTDAAQAVGKVRPVSDTSLIAPMLHGCGYLPARNSRLTTDFVHATRPP